MKLALALVLALPLAIVSASQAGIVGVSSPLLLWSNQALVGSGKGHSVSYQVRDGKRWAPEFLLGAYKAHTSLPECVCRWLQIPMLLLASWCWELLASQQLVHGM